MNARTSTHARTHAYTHTHTHTHAPADTRQLPSSYFDFQIYLREFQQRINNSTSWNVVGVFCLYLIIYSSEAAGSGQIYLRTTITHIRTHARMHVRMHARTHARTHARMHTHINYNTQQLAVRGSAGQRSVSLVDCQSRILAEPRESRKV